MQTPSCHCCFHVSKIILQLLFPFQLGTDVLLCAWIGPETLVVKATIISVDPDTIVGREPLGPETYEVIVNVSLKKDVVLPYQYDGLLYISDAVKMSIAWPSTKVITKNVCSVHVAYTC